MLKKTLWILCAFTLPFFSFAQNITIPDPNFKAYVVGQFDSNLDGEISQAEALNASTLNCSNLGITDVTGLAYFKNATTIDFDLNPISMLPDLSEFQNLEELTCGNTNLTSLVLTQGLENLEFVRCSYSQLTTLEISNLPKLREIHGYGNQLTTLSQIHDLPALYRLNIHTNQLNDFPDFSTLPNLLDFNVNNNVYLSMEGIQNAVSLFSIDFLENQLSSLPDLSALHNLSTARITLNYLDQGDCPQIEALISQGVNVTYDEQHVPSQASTLTLDCAGGSPNQAPIITGQQPLSLLEDDSLVLSTTDLIIDDPDSGSFTLILDPGPNYSLSGLRVTPDLDFFGTLNVPAQVSDGEAQSATFNLSLTVQAVNDAPSFYSGPSQYVAQNAGQQTVAGWATEISAGPANESGQQISFVVLSNTNPELFAAGPSVSAAGDLSYTPANAFSGEAELLIALQDNGAGSAPDVNISVPQALRIETLAVNQAPVITGQNPIIMSSGGSLTLELEDLLVSDPDNVYPDDFTLLIEVGAANLREGVQVTPFPLLQSDALQCVGYLFSGLTLQADADFEGILKVPVRVSDGELESEVFELEIEVSAFCESCQALLQKDPNANSGTYTIDPDLDGPAAPVEVYCNMAMGGGWTLVDTRTNYERANHTETALLTDPVLQNNVHIPKTSWLPLRDAATELMITETENANNYVIFDVEELFNANCTTLVDDLSQTPIFHNEQSGCSFTGSDYTYCSNPSYNQFFTTVTMYHRAFPVKERSGAYGTTGTTQQIYYAPLHISIYVR